MIEVRSRVRPREDRAGDPLDGLVNLFDLGIVLAVAFLIAALQSADLTQLLTKRSISSQGNQVTLKPDEKLTPLQPGQRRVQVAPGGSIGEVYRLPDGRLVYVAKK